MREHEDQGVCIFDCGEEIGLGDDVGSELNTWEILGILVKFVDQFGERSTVNLINCDSMSVILARFGLKFD